MERIEHVVVLMLENKSFHSVFGDFPNVTGSMRSKYAKENAVNYDLKGNAHFPRKIQDNAFRFSKYLDNNAISTMHQLENRNSGFVKVLDQAFKDNQVGPYKSQDTEKKLIENTATADEDSTTGSFDVSQPLFYFAQGALKCTHKLAKNYVICDQYYSSVPGATWPNRLMALSGTSKGIYETPVNITEVPFQRMLKQNQTTIFDLMLEKNVSFKVFYGDFPLSLLLESNWKKEILEHHVPMSEFYEMCAIGNECNFPKFAWIEPKYGADGNDSHPPHMAENAEALIGNVYNALRNNSKLWDKTLLIVTYDEVGGLYDPVVPPLAWEHRNSSHRYNNKQSAEHTHGVFKHFFWNPFKSESEGETDNVQKEQQSFKEEEHMCDEQKDIHSSLCSSEWVLDDLASVCHDVCTEVYGFDVNRVYNRAPSKYCRHIFGLRVPTLLASPWLSPRVESCVYDHTSILHSLCQKWNLDPTRLGPRVPLATTFWHIFNNNEIQLNNNKQQKKRSKKTKKVPNTFGLLKVPKHDNTSYSGQPGNWSHFQMEMFSSICWTLQSIGQLPTLLKHPLLTMQHSWNTVTSWIHGICNKNL